MKRKKKPLTNEEFVVAWQQAESLSVVVAKTGLTRRKASVRAFGMRQAGVPLKRFRELHSGLDVAALAKLARATREG